MEDGVKLRELIGERIQISDEKLKERGDLKKRKSSKNPISNSMQKKKLPKIESEEEKKGFKEAEMEPRKLGVTGVLRSRAQGNPPNLQIPGQVNTNPSGVDLVKQDEAEVSFRAETMAKDEDSTQSAPNADSPILPETPGQIIQDQKPKIVPKQMINNRNKKPISQDLPVKIIPKAKPASKLYIQQIQKDINDLRQRRSKTPNRKVFKPHQETPIPSKIAPKKRARTPVKKKTKERNKSKSKSKNNKKKNRNN